MLVFEAKLEGEKHQYEKLDEAIPTARFVRNCCIKYWIENKAIGRYELSAYCKVLTDEFSWANKLNSMARQAWAERAWSAIARFDDNCKKKAKKKGFPRFKKHQTHGCVEYKTCGWKLSEDRRTITFTDGFKAGSFKMWAPRNLHFYQLEQIKRVRVVGRADRYYVQFCINQERVERREPTGKTIGIDAGLNHFYTDSNGQTVENPRHLRKSEKALKRLSKRLSRTQKGSKNTVKATNRLSRKHLKVSRQRKDFAVKLARCPVQSNDLVAYEDLQVQNMVRNKKLAKSISDAAWSVFRQWLAYFGKVFGVLTVAVPPHYTSINCSKCGGIVKKSLSTRTHKCHHCGLVLNILELALRTVGYTGTHASGDIDLCIGEETPQCKPSRGKRKPKK